MTLKLRLLTAACCLAVALPAASLAQGPGGGVAGVDQGPGRQRPPRAALGRRTEEPRGTAVLRGQVVAADTGAPIRRAQVRVSGGEARVNRLATTDAQGRFEITELPAARYTVSASKGGFVTLEYGQRRPSEAGTPIELADGQALEKLVIALPRGSVIGGRITDEFGEPIANALVTALRYGYARGQRQLLPAGGQNARDTTDDLGQFRLFGLQPGDYVVSASYRMGGREVTDPAEDATGYAPTYYPGTANLSEAQRVQVDVGQEQTAVFFSLVATRLARLSGTVVNSQGQPVGGGVVLIAPAGGGLGAAMMLARGGGGGRIDGSGAFEIPNVAPGSYVLQVRGGAGPAARAGAAEFARQEITVGGQDVDGLLLVTAPAARATGTVTTASGALPPFSPNQVQVAARPLDPSTSPMAGGGGTRLEDDWTFAIGNLIDAQMFRVNAPAGWTLDAVRLKGEDVTDRGIAFAPGQTVSGIQVVLTDRISTLSGRVTDGRGEPALDATVVIFPADEGLWTYQSRYIRAARPDLEGRYQIRALPPFGKYLAAVVQGVQDGQAGDPEFLERIRDGGVAFAIDEGETKTLDLQLRR